MSELTLQALGETARTMDAVFDRFFQPRAPQPERESDELAMRIADETTRALHSLSAWDAALFDMDDAERARLLALPMQGEDIQFGVRLSQAIRRQVIATATQRARDVFNGDA